jgi:hypothetical protein
MNKKRTTRKACNAAESVRLNVRRFSAYDAIYRPNYRCMNCVHAQSVVVASSILAAGVRLVDSGIRASCKRRRIRKNHLTSS